MEAIQYITNSEGANSGLLIDFESAKKSIHSKKGLIALMEDIEDIIAVELTKKEKTFSYEEARKQLFAKKG